MKVQSYDNSAVAPPMTSCVVTRHLNAQSTEISGLCAAGLHIKPLTPILAKLPEPDAAFMSAYTRPAFFASELVLFALIGSVLDAR